MLCIRPTNVRVVSSSGESSSCVDIPPFLAAGSGRVAVRVTVQQQPVRENKALPLTDGDASDRGDNDVDDDDDEGS